MREKFLTFKAFVIKYANIIFFVGGFLFDSLTLVRIDSVLDLALQTVYLAAITFLIVLKTRVDLGLWKPEGRMEKIWEFESEAIHFFYGGLLSAYVVFYFKSTTGFRSLFFLLLVAVLMIANEMPKVREAGSDMRLGLYAFCLVSFLNYLFPVLIGQMGALIFSGAWLVSVLLTGALINYLAKRYPDPARARVRMSWAPAGVLLLVAGLYTVKLIPPVPLSMQYAGVFRSVTREGDRFKLIYQKPPWYAFWRKDNRKFAARPGDQIYCFTRVFAPRRFRHQIYMSWYKKNEATGDWMGSDRVPMTISGGRDDGFRGFSVKSHYDPGLWRVDIETEDGRILGGVHLNVRADDSTDERKWVERWM